MNRILFVIYTPFEGYLPKRMAELNQRVKLDKVAQVVVTPSTYRERLFEQTADTVHLIKLYPDNDVDAGLTFQYYQEEKELTNFVEGIKSHNIQVDTTNTDTK